MDNLKSNNSVELALIICTRNRSDLLQRLLKLIARQMVIPDYVVVVDSSDDDSSKLIVKHETTLPRVFYVKSHPGLPHQRNMGIRFLKSQFKNNEISFISFLDDDIAIDPHYFENVKECFSENPEAVIVGGFDRAVIHRPGNRITQFLGIRGMLPGMILKSGITSYPNPNSAVSEVSWVPGGMSNYRKWVFDQYEFRGQVRMYGEDIEMQLKVRKFGKIIVSKKLAVSHLSATLGKDDKRSQASYGDGFRWWLAKTYRPEFSRFWVLITTILLSIQCLAFSLALLNKAKLDEFFGHLDFVSRLIFRKSTEQFVNHQEWI
jgi:GT2 family glycosyltransferase